MKPPTKKPIKEAKVEPVSAPVAQETPAKVAKQHRIPHSPEAEDGVIGCALINPRKAIPAAVSQIKESDFYVERNQQAYREIIKLWDKNAPVDLISVSNAMGQSGFNLAWLDELENSTPSAENIGYYIDILKEKSTLRRVLEVCRGGVHRVQNFSDSKIDLFLDDIERQVMGIRQDKVRGGLVSIRDIMRTTLDDFDKILTGQGKLLGMTTGFHDLDFFTGGLWGGELTLLAARPSVGKTSLSLNIVENLAVLRKVPTAVFSYEMTARQLSVRLLSSMTRIDCALLRSGNLTEAQVKLASDAAAKIGAAPLHIDDDSSSRILELRAKARAMVAEHGVKFIVIDYLQLIPGDGGNRKNRDESLGEISSGLKNISKELGVPVMVISSLNRDTEKENRAPRLSDLRESGRLEFDADTVIMLWQDKKDQDKDFVRARIAKQRNGKQGEFKLKFNASCVRFETADASPNFPAATKQATITRREDDDD